MLKGKITHTHNINKVGKRGGRKIKRITTVEKNICILSHYWLLHDRILYHLEIILTTSGENISYIWRKY